MLTRLACRYASIDMVCDRLTRKLRKVKEKAISKGKWQGRGGPKGSSSIKQQEVKGIRKAFAIMSGCVPQCVQISEVSTFISN